jgi:hypothetical protein
MAARERSIGATCYWGYLRKKRIAQKSGMLDVLEMLSGRRHSFFFIAQQSDYTVV